ncbi:MAG TPA: leucyl aminopeptidase [Ectothiorhodospiraceae bacterium]|nr:leucyl aminopeptidase [Ectothiorhodospiraceae bacterium]
MQFTTKTGSLSKVTTACLVIGVHEKRKLPPEVVTLDKATGGAISALLKSGDMDGKAGSTTLLHNINGVKAKRILLVGCGDIKSCTAKDFRKIARASAEVLKALPVNEVVSALSAVEVSDFDLAAKVRSEIESYSSCSYTFNQLKTDDGNGRKKRLKNLAFHSHGRSEMTQINSAIKQGSAIGAGIKLTRDLSNLPGNICTPTYLANQARRLAKSHSSIKTTILDEKQMKRLGMGALLSVSRGSRQPAKLITMEYRGKGVKAGTKPIVLVGKGLTFDAGGISLKPSAKMDEMKYDMCGGASVFGTMQAVAEMGLPIHLVGIVPSSENMPDGDANKPGDIVTSMSGQTIEILNTDAEGRLILCDALTYAKKFKPEVIIDIATLTGAVIVALGHHITGVMGNDEPLIDELLSAGKDAGDRAWQLPLGDEYDEQLKSPFADMANIGGPGAGSITAACFLARYTKEYRWAHLDIAGTAWNSNGIKGASGRPVPMLTQFLINRAKK